MRQRTLDRGYEHQAGFREGNPRNHRRADVGPAMNQERSLTRKLLPLGFGLIGVVALILVLMWFAIEIEIGVAGLLNADATWAKAQKQAMVELDRYAAFHDPQSMRRFDAAVAILDKDRIARNLVLSRHFKRGEVVNLFKQAKVMPRAISASIFALEYLNNVGFLHRALQAWIDTDARVDELHAIAKKLQAMDPKAAGYANESAAIRERIYQLDLLVSPKTDAFSSAVADGADRYTNMLFWGVVLVALSAMTLWFVMARKILAGIRATEDRYRDLFDAAPDGIIIYDEMTGRVLDANRVARFWIGPNLWSVSFADLFSSEERFTYTGRTGESALIYADGTTKPVETQTSRILWGGRYVRQAFVRDIRDRVAVDRERRVAAVMGHEMRNPLNAIITAARLIGDSTADQGVAGLKHFIVTASRLLKEQGASAPDSPELIAAIHRAATHLIEAKEDASGRRELFSMMISNAQLLLSRLNDVIDMVAINNGSLSFHPVPFSVGRLVEMIHDETQPQARAKFQQLLIASTLDRSVILYGDVRRIQQAVSNMVFNAIKYSPEGSPIEVDLSPIFTNETSVGIAIRISDRGMGIPEAHKAKIFDAYFQARKVDSSNYDGLGLGLYVVKSVSDAMGGALQVMDNPGGGTVFEWTFALPRSRDDQIGEADLPLESHLDRHKRSVSPLRCLIADDTPSNRAVLRHALQRAGHDTEEAADGCSAVAQLVARRFDVLLLDMNMPGLSGEEVLTRIARARVSGLEGLSVIVISADALAARSIMREFPNVVGVMCKPINVEELLERLAHVDGQRHGVQRIEDAAHGLLTATNKFDQAATAAIELLQTMEPDVLQSFLEASDQGMRSQAEAIEHALLVSSPDEFAFAVHALKNEFQNIGYDSGARYCAEINKVPFVDLAGADVLPLLRGHIREGLEVVQRLRASAPDRYEPAVE